MPHLRFLRVNDAGQSVLRDELAARKTRVFLTHVGGTGPVFVGKHGVILTSQPAFIIDIAGGCCRPASASCFQLQNGSRCVKQKEHAFARSAVEPVLKLPDVRLYPWLYLMTHSHSSTYFHSMGEALPRLLYGLDLVRTERHIKAREPQLCVGRGDVRSWRRVPTAQLVFRAKRQAGITQPLC